MIDKLKVFADELNLIQHPQIRAFTEKCIERTPDYFYRVPASSTGKYHPEYSLGDGGLIRHTKALVYFAKELLELEHNRQRFTPAERDSIIAAGILHDSFKHGDNYSQYSVANHPVVAADHILEWAEAEEEKNYSAAIATAVRSHMGEWCCDYKTKEPIMPKPETDKEKFLHECDYLASRKNVIVQGIDYEPIDYMPLEDVIQEIISLCKNSIAEGFSRVKLVEFITNNNNGSPDPRKVEKLDKAVELYKNIKWFTKEVK